MEKQYWGSIHVLPDQTQTGETDGRMREFLSGLHFKSPKTFLDDVGKWYNGLTSSYSMMFMNVGYVDKYTNLSKKDDFRVSIYGISGIHHIARVSRYVNYYISEEQTLLGQDFFPYVFGSFYFSEEEARDASEKVSALLDRKTAIKKKVNYHAEITENDRELVCRIVERLWSCQLEDVGTRLIICFERQENAERAVELLKQIYLLLPQRLRMSMGFCTNSNQTDIHYLTETCELPIHIFTMSVTDLKQQKEEFAKGGFKYPVVLFSAEHPEKEPCNQERLELIRELSRKISPSSDAKLAYAEKTVLKEKRGAQVSFENLQKTFEKVNEKNFCWWEREDLGDIEDIYHLYMDQSEMMHVEILHDEAINTFYRKLLPYKEYAAQIAAVVENDSYPNRQEILDFFSEELKFAKVIEAMQKMRGNLERKAAKREEEAVADINNRWKADVAQRQQRHGEALSEKDKECSRLRIEKEQSAQEYELRLQRQDERFAEERSAKEKELETALRHEADKMQKEIAAERERSSSEISRLNSEITKLQSTDVNRKLRELQNKLNESGEQKEQIRGQAEDAVQKKKLFQITTIVASSVAIIFLVISIIFVMKGSGVGELTQANEKLESEKVVLESERAGLQSTQAELESQVAVLKNENTTLESEKEVLENIQKETESQAGETAVEKTLIVYYTYAKGSTRAVAEEIQKQTGAKIFELKTVEEYPTDHDSVVQKLANDYQNGVASQLSNTVDHMADYDTIFLGYPVWGGTMPSAISTFISQYDLTGKTVIPFCTYDNSGTAETGKQLREAKDGINFRETLEISDSHIFDDGAEGGSTESEAETGESGNEPTEAESSAKEDTSEFTEQVSEWLAGLGLPKKN